MTRDELLGWRKELARVAGELQDLGDYDTNAGRIRRLYQFSLYVCQHLLDNTKLPKS